MIGCGGWSEEQRVKNIARMTTWEGRIATVTDQNLPARLREDFDWDCHWIADTARMRRELGYEERISFQQGLSRTVEWEKNHPPANVDPNQFNYAAEDAVLNGQSGNRS